MSTKNKPQTSGSQRPHARGPVAQQQPEANREATGTDSATQRGYEESRSQQRATETEINKGTLKGGAVDATNQADECGDCNATQGNTQYPGRASTGFARDSGDTSNIDSTNDGDTSDANAPTQGRTVAPTNPATAADPKNKAC